MNLKVKHHIRKEVEFLSHYFVVDGSLLFFVYAPFDILGLSKILDKAIGDELLHYTLQVLAWKI